MRKITRVFTIVVILFLVSLAITTFYVFHMREVVFAENSYLATDQFKITGDSFTLLDGWHITFCWRKTGGPWMLYYLDHESPRWPNAEIRLQKDRAIVMNDAKKIAYLDLGNGSFHYTTGGRVDTMPLGIVTAESPFDRNAITYPESPGWESMWPMAMGIDDKVKTTVE